MNVHQRFQTGLIYIALILSVIPGLTLQNGCTSSENQQAQSSQTNTSPGTSSPAQEPADPAEVAIGERLFLETRFAQSFKTFLDQGGKVNSPLPTGDPVMDTSVTTGQPLPGPFAGLSMNCRACHLVDEHLHTAGGGMRTYADFARRSPVPDRGDGKTTTPRNSPPLVNASLPRFGGPLFHFDGEFASMEDLVASTFTGRNFGWLPGEQAEAIAHVARVVREDDGKGDLAKDFGGVLYATILTGTDPSIPDEFRLPDEFRINVATATDQELFDAINRLVAAYVESLVFSQDDQGDFNLSPFDVFLSLNNLPKRPDAQESATDYSRRLLKVVKARESAGSLLFVVSNPDSEDGKFKFHDQPFTFGALELEGLKIFFGEAPPGPLSQTLLQQGKLGNCLVCHPAPRFTDFRFHNTGTTQIEFDSVHGTGAFSNLAIPDLAARNANPDLYLPATPQHPNAKEPFRSPPGSGDPMLSDLGLWNVFANPDFSAPQTRIRNVLCGDSPLPCGSDTQLLPQTVGLFKTPGLRDLGHSAPYMHNGQFDSLEDIITFYRRASALARAGTLRNGASELIRIALTANDTAALVAFLKSLNEDYE